MARTSPAYERSEFIGIDRDGPLYGKSLESLSESEKNSAILGVNRLWTSFFEEAGLVETEFVSLSRESLPSLYDLVLTVLLRKFNVLLKRHLRPTFVRSEQSLPWLKGKYDPVNVEYRTLLGVQEFQCKVSDLTYSIPPLQAIKDAYNILSRRAICDGLAPPQFLQTIMAGLHLLRHVPASPRPIHNAQLVISRLGSTNHGQSKNGSGTLPRKIQPLSNVVRFSAELLAYNLRGVVSNTLGINGIALNLNYLLERVVRSAMESIGGTQDPKVFPGNAINEISTFVERENEDRFMRPDCFGILRAAQLVPTYANEKELLAQFDEHLYVFDAKHKLFYTQSDGLQRISRSDFYQIVSYARTHHRTGQPQAIYALVGLEEENTVNKDVKNLLPGRYIGIENPGRLASTKISFRDLSGRNSTEVTIHHLPLRFGQFLFDFGTISQSSNPKELFQRLALDILAAIAKKR